MLKFHPVHPLIIAVIQSFILTVSNCYFDFVFCIAVTLMSIASVCEELKTFKIFRFCIFTVPAIVGIFITSFLFARCDSSRLQTALNISLRVFGFSFVSTLCFINLDFERLIIDFMKRKILSVDFGYALLSVFRSFGIIRDRFYQIVYCARVRKIGFFSIIIPLIVSVVMQSQNQAISLYNRGLCETKGFNSELIKFGLADLVIIMVQVLLLIFIFFKL